jgi:hypothetical protein
MKYGVVIANRFEDIIAPLIDSIRAKIPRPPPIMIVADGHDRDYGFMKVKYDDPHFAFPRAINMGIKEMMGYDILILNDDCKILEWNFFDRLAELAYARATIGILSPLVVGCAGNPVQRWHERGQHWRPSMDFVDVPAPATVCFPCVYVKRELLDQIGLLNEKLAGYGMDDVDMCNRARTAGWKTAITQRVLIQHADGSAALGEGRGKSWATSFARRWEGGVPPKEEVAAYLNRLKKRD